MENSDQRQDATELAKRLRNRADVDEMCDRYNSNGDAIAQLREAADELDRLTAELRRCRSREVLTELATVRGQLAEANGLLREWCDMPSSWFNLLRRTREFVSRTSAPVSVTNDQLREWAKAGPPPESATLPADEMPAPHKSIHEAFAEIVATIPESELDKLEPAPATCQPMSGEQLRDFYHDATPYSECSVAWDKTDSWSRDAWNALAAHIWPPAQPDRREEVAWHKIGDLIVGRMDDFDIVLQSRGGCMAYAELFRRGHHVQTVGFSPTVPFSQEHKAKAVALAMKESEAASCNR